MSARPAMSRHARRMQIVRRRRLRRTVTVTVGLLLLGTVVARAGEPTRPVMLTVSDHPLVTPAPSATAVIASGPAATASSGTSQPTRSSTPTADATTSAASTPTTTATSAASATAADAGVTIEPGTYVLWKKSANEVFLVKDGAVQRAMPTTDLDWKTPVGDYRVYLRQRNTIGYDEQGRIVHLEYFVAYHKSPLGGDIGFHQMPYYSDGSLIEPMADLGMPGWSSEGCGRLSPSDALAVWDFAPIGMVVKVR